MSRSGSRTIERAPGRSSGPTRSARPRTTATGSRDALPFTRSAAAASSSATHGIVTTSGRPSASVCPRRSSNTCTPPAPIAESVWPSRHARPSVSETMTPTSHARAASAARRRERAPRHPDPREAAARCRAGCSTRRRRRRPRRCRAVLDDPRRVAAAGSVREATTPDRLGGDRVFAVVGGDHAALGLRHDLGRDDQDVAVLQRGAGAPPRSPPRGPCPG